MALERAIDLPRSSRLQMVVSQPPDNGVEVVVERVDIGVDVELSPMRRLFAGGSLVEIPVRRFDLFDNDRIRCLENAIDPPADFEDEVLVLDDVSQRDFLPVAFAASIL